MGEKKLELEDFIKDLNLIGGIERCSQPGFCMLMALWMKAIELQSMEVSMSKTELYFKGGFKSNRSFYDTRKSLQQLGFFECEKEQGTKSVSMYRLNTCIVNAVEIGIKSVTQCDMKSVTKDDTDNGIDNVSNNDIHRNETNNDTEKVSNKIPIYVPQDASEIGIETQTLINEIDTVPDNVIETDIKNGMDNDIDEGTTKHINDEVSKTSSRDDLVVDLFTQYDVGRNKR